MPLKVMTIVGTRPEIIRLSRVIARLDATDGIEHVLVHTGQNYDHALSQIFFDDLGLPNDLLVLTVSEGRVDGHGKLPIEELRPLDPPRSM